MAKYTIQAAGKKMLLSTQKIKQYLKDHPNHEIGVKISDNMPVSLHNLIGDHNKNVKPK